MAPVNAMVLCASSPDSVLSVPVRRLHVVFSLPDLRAEERLVIRHAGPPRRGEASRKSRAPSGVRTQAIGALAHGSNNRATRAPPYQKLCK